MAGRNYSLNSNKPLFSTTDDDMAAAFMNTNSAPYLAADRLPKSPEERAVEDAERRQKELYQQMRQIEQRTLDSTKRSMGAIIESEKIGIETAQDLLRQREQLTNTEARLDDMNSTLKDSQKNINGIKSVFSSLKQWWTTPKNAPQDAKGAKSPTSPTNPSPDVLVAKNPNLRAAMENTESSIPVAQGPHPALRGLYEDEEEDEPSDISQFRAHTRKVNQQLDSDLDNMSRGLRNLKGLALGLGDEIADQNEMITNIQHKADKADLVIHKQTKEIRQILKK